MMRVWTGAVAVCAIAAGACERAESPLVPSEYAIRADVVQATDELLKVSGRVKYDSEEGEDRGDDGLRFSAERPGGAVSGTFRLKTKFGKDRILLSGSVICYTVVDNRVRMAGRVDASNTEGIPVGSELIWNYTDNEDNTLDSASQLLGVAAGGGEAFCALGGFYPEHVIKNGRLQIVRVQPRGHARGRVKYHSETGTARSIDQLTFKARFRGGETTGTFRMKTRFGTEKVDIRGTILCMTIVDGRRARMAGRVDRSSVAYIPVGTEQIWNVTMGEDGEGSSASQLLGTGPGLGAAFCAEGGFYPEAPVEKGKIRVETDDDD